MPLDVEQIDLSEEIDRLEEEMDETAEEQVEWEGDPAYARQLMRRGHTLHNRIAGLRRLTDEQGVETVTLAGLTAGERKLAEDITDEYGTSSTAAYVAVGTRKAPWLSHNPEAPLAQQMADIAETCKNVFDLPPAVMDWADERVGDLTHLRGETGNEYLDLLGSKMAQETPQNENG